MKTKFASFVKKSLVFACVCVVASSVLAAGTIKVAQFVENPVPTYTSADVNIPRRSVKPLTMKEWVMKEVAKAGMDIKLADKIINCESKWNPDAHAVNWNNKAGVDRGLWQINSASHKEVSNACAYDFKCNTLAAIKIYKSRGNYSAWSCLPIALAKN